MSRFTHRLNSPSQGSSNGSRVVTPGLVLTGLATGCLIAMFCRVGVNAEEQATEPVRQSATPSSQTAQPSKAQSTQAQSAKPAPTQPTPARPQRFVPPSHAELYEKLNTRRIQLDFKKTPVEEALQTLSAALGAPIELDRTGMKPDESIGRVTLSTDEPITIQNALRQTLQHTVGLRITFSETGVRMRKWNAEDQQYVLLTHDLRRASNYSTALRAELIEQILRSVTPGEWQQLNGPWIGPSTSVFGIDVYHRPEAHTAIQTFWSENYLAASNRSVTFRQKLEQAERVRRLTPAEIEARAEELRQQYPFQSLVERLEYESGKHHAEPALAPKVEQRLADRENHRVGGGRGSMLASHSRIKALKELHSSEVAAFVKREGAGLRRIPVFDPEPSNLPLYEPPAIVLPSANLDPPTYAESPADLPRDAAEALAGTYTFPTEQTLTVFHNTSEQQFLSPEKLGYIKSREAVAGFAGHGIKWLPRIEDQLPETVEPTEHWAMRRLELVSLLKHPTPKVYRSDTLPSMDKLASAPTRSLTEFESTALARLAAEEDVVVRASTNRIEMLGAVRAAKNCLECHTVERGQLLGAFSYTLVRDPLITAK